MKIITEGIVLRYFRYGDNGVIAHIYTRDYGRQTFIFKGAKSSKTQRKVNFLQPLFLLNLPIDYRPQKEMYAGNAAQLAHNYGSIPFQYTKSSIAFFIAELLSKTLQTQEADNLLFDFLKEAFFYLDNPSTNGRNFHLTFLAKFSKFIGIQPAENLSKATPYFSILQGEYISTQLADCLDEAQSILVDQLQKNSWKDCDKIALSHHQRNAFLEKWLQYYHQHCHDFGQLQSLAVLQELFK